MRNVGCFYLSTFTAIAASGCSCASTRTSPAGDASAVDATAPAVDAAAPASDAGASASDGGDADATSMPDDSSWVVTFGSVEHDYPMDVDADDAGNVVVGGYFSAPFTIDGTTVPYDGGRLDAFVAKLSRDGDLVWARTVAGSGAEREVDVAVGADGSVVFATEHDAPLVVDGTTVEHRGSIDFVVVTHEPDGAVRWVRSFGGPDMELQPRVAVDGTGDVLLAAMYEGTVSFDSTELTAVDARDIVVARLAASDGRVLWARTYGGGADESAYRIETDDAGDVVLVGWYGNTIDFGGGPLSGGAAFVAKLAGADGAHRWSVSSIGEGNDAACGLAIGRDGSVLVSGWFQDELDLGGGRHIAFASTDLWLARLDGATGAHRWSRAFGGSSVDSSCSVGALRDGTGLFGGIFSRSIDLGGEPFTATAQGGFITGRADVDGAHVHSAHLGELVHVHDIEVDGDDAVLALGTFVDERELFGHTVSSVGGTDAFLARVPSRALESHAAAIGGSPSR